MSNSEESYKAIINDLRERIKVLREEKLKLEDKLVNTLSKHSSHYDLTVSIPPDEERIYRNVISFIEKAKTQLIVATKSLSSDILNLILRRMNDLEDITIITNERHQISIEDSINCFDTLAATPKIHHISNSNMNCTFIITDKADVLLLSSPLLKAELNTKLNTALKISDERIVDQFWKFYKYHLPTFMR
ncbi:MAG: hypothetical protein ACTSRG_13825 [Candidatus Helarchaeota archaeon]